MEFLFWIRVIADIFVSSYLFGFGVILLTSCIKTSEIKALVLTLCSLPIILSLYYLERLIINIHINKSKVKHNLFLGLTSLFLIIIYFIYMFISPVETYMNRTLVILIFAQMFFGNINVDE